MTTHSAKAKGRRFQQEVAAAFLKVGSKYGLAKDDIKSTAMGQSGVDVQFSPAGQALFYDPAVEVKNVEALNVVGVFTKHSEKYPGNIPLLFHKRNHTEPMVTLRMRDFFFFLDGLMNSDRAKGSM